MTSMSSNPSFGLNRRAAMGGAGAAAAAAALSLASRVNPVSAQDAESLADHPLAGVWLAMANPPLPDDPPYPAASLFAADGTVLLMSPVTQTGPNGVQFTSDLVGTWEADSDRRGHFTTVQLLSDAEGKLLGSVTLDGFPEVSEDGLTFIDDGSLVTVTIRDAAGAIVNQILPTGQPAGRPVTAVRMGVGSPGFPAGDAATPSP